MQPNNAQPDAGTLTTTHWHCERCKRTGQVEHDAHAGIVEVFSLVYEDHHMAGWCIEPDYIRVWKATPQPHAAGE